MPDSPPEAFLRRALTRFGWRERFVLLVPVFGAISLASIRGKPALEAAIATLLIAAVAACAVRRPRLRRGTWFRRADRAPQLQVVERSALMVAGTALLEQATADRRPLSVAVLELHDLPEVRRLFGRKLTQQVLARTARKLRAVAGPKGLVARTSPTQFTLVLPGVDQEAVLFSLRTVFGDACCIEDESGTDEVVLLPHFQVATVGAPAPSVESAYVLLCERLVSSSHRARVHAPSIPAEPEPMPPVTRSPSPCELAQRDTLPAYVPTLPLPLR